MGEVRTCREVSGLLFVSRVLCRPPGHVEAPLGTLSLIRRAASSPPRNPMCNALHKCSQMATLPEGGAATPARLIIDQVVSFQCSMRKAWPPSFSGMDAALTETYGFVPGFWPQKSAVSG